LTAFLFCSISSCFAGAAAFAAFARMLLLCALRFAELDIYLIINA